MKHLTVMKGTTNPLTPDQNIVFKKLLEIRGPKIYTDTYTARWIRAYRRAVKDFRDIYGFEPEIIYKEGSKYERVK